jgi:RNA polymerase sigma-70 factor (ECF subfamily)
LTALTALTDRRPTTPDTVAAAVRRGRLAVVATLVRLTGDFDLAEDCWQDAVERALIKWPADGVPDKPEAWLSVVARNRALDVIRRRRTELDRLHDLHAASRSPRATPGAMDDDRLKLLFACCHPALPAAGRVALTLKTVTGLSTREVARAFLVSEATMGQRLLRTKTKIKNAGIALRVPPADQVADRIDGVLAVIYLLFTEGYSATEGPPLRDALTREAIGLALLMVDLLPAHDEARALLALTLLQDSRRRARVGGCGELVPIDEQDRALWDRGQIDAGLRTLFGIPPDHAPGPYRLQAAIAALHATAPRAESTDWGRIVEAYDALLALQDSPVIALNRLVALSFRDGPERALDLLPALQQDLADYPPLHAVRADLLRRAARVAEAIPAYRIAMDQARTDAERRFLARRLSELSDMA